MTRLRWTARASCGKVDPVFRSTDALIERGSIGWVPKVHIHFWVRCFSFLLLVGPALAEDAPEDKALRFSVRPSGAEPEVNEAIERQQKLLKRLERSNHTVRSICINCGDDWQHQIYAPFDPYASLGRPAPPSEEDGH